MAFEGLKITSYNCRGLPKTRNKLMLRPDILSLSKENDIIDLQEIHFSKQDLNGLNSLLDNYVGTGVAKIDESSNIVQGRYPGGVALMWRSSISQYVKPIQLDVDWCVAVEICIGAIKYIILNI